MKLFTISCCFMVTAYKTFFQTESGTQYSQVSTAVSYVETLTVAIVMLLGDHCNYNYFIIIIIILFFNVVASNAEEMENTRNWQQATQTIASRDTNILKSKKEIYVLGKKDVSHVHVAICVVSKT
jgi:hypothetical protein